MHYICLSIIYHWSLGLRLHFSNAVMNMGLQMLLRDLTFNSFQHLLRGGVAELCCKIIFFFFFLRNYSSIFQSNCTSLPFHQQSTSVSVSPHSLLKGVKFFCVFLQATSHRSWGSVQINSIAQLCLTLCDPMNHSMPGLPVHPKLPDFTQTHVHRVGDAIQPSHPLSAPSPASNPSQHQSLFQ